MLYFFLCNVNLGGFAIMKKHLSRKLVFLIVFASIIAVFAIAMIIIESIPEPIPVFQAVADVAETNEDTMILVSVLLNDTDIDTTTLVILDFTQGTHGTVSKTANGLRYRPSINYVGTDTFTYTLQNSALETMVATVTVTVKPVNDQPLASNDYYSTLIDTSVLIDVLLNDSDVDGDTLSVASFYALPDHGTITMEDGKIRYTPNAGYTGTDVFAYRVTDSNGGSDTAQVTVNVLPNQD